MRNIHLSIYFKPVKADLVLPIHYNHIVQAAIYNSIDFKLAAFLHEKGFLAGKRTFRMFAFSLLRGPYNIDKNHNSIKFTSEIQLTVSSPVDEFCQSLVNTLLTRGCIRLGEAEVAVEKVYAQKFKVEKEEVPIKTLSPVVLYSTLLRPDGRKYTCYFQPGEADYDKLLNSNLQKKYSAFYQSEPPAGAIVFNTVRAAQEAYREWSKILGKERVLCYHSQFIMKDRQDKETALLEKDEKGRPKNYDLLIATQAIEVSLDISFDVMYSECAPLRQSDPEGRTV